MSGIMQLVFVEVFVLEVSDLGRAKTSSGLYHVNPIGQAFGGVGNGSGGAPCETRPAGFLSRDIAIPPDEIVKRAESGNWAMP